MWGSSSSRVHVCLLRCPALDEHIQQLHGLPLIPCAQPFELLELAAQAGADGFRRRFVLAVAVEQFIGAYAQRLGQPGKNTGRRVLGLALVVGDHSARNADFLGQFLLGESGGLAQTGEASTESGQIADAVLWHKTLHGFVVYARSISGGHVHLFFSRRKCLLECTIFVHYRVTKSKHSFRPKRA